MRKLKHRTQTQGWRRYTLPVVLAGAALLLPACIITQSPYGAIESVPPGGNIIDVAGVVFTPVTDAVFIKGLSNCNLSISCLQTDVITVLNYTGGGSQVDSAMDNAVADCWPYDPQICGQQLYQAILYDTWNMGGNGCLDAAITPSGGFDWYGNFPPFNKGSSNDNGGGWGVEPRTPARCS